MKYFVRVTRLDTTCWNWLNYHFSSCMVFKEKPKISLFLFNSRALGENKCMKGMYVHFKQSGAA